MEHPALSKHVPSAWYADFFTYLPNEFWRRVAGAEWTAAEIAFMESRLGLPGGARILDAPCGSGRHSLGLAQRGYQVTGLDLSAEAIAYARRAAAAVDAASAVTFEQRDMRDLAGLGVFDAAICLGNSFCYLDGAGTRTFVAALAAAVRPGGGLVIDVGSAAESILPGLSADTRVMETGDITVEATMEYDATTSRLLSHYRFAQGVQVVEASAAHYVRTSSQLGELLSEAGFTDVQHYGDVDGTAFAVGSHRLLLTARRQ